MNFEDIRVIPERDVGEFYQYDYNLYSNQPYLAANNVWAYVGNKVALVACAEYYLSPSAEEKSLTIRQKQQLNEPICAGAILVFDPEKTFLEGRTWEENTSGVTKLLDTLETRLVDNERLMAISDPMMQYRLIFNQREMLAEYQNAATVVRKALRNSKRPFSQKEVDSHPEYLILNPREETVFFAKYRDFGFLDAQIKLVSGQQKKRAPSLLNKVRV